jgi:PAS domain S-box-containing protein
MPRAARRPLTSAPSPLWLAKVAAVGVGYYVTAKLGLRLASVTPYVTAVWPPTGVAVAGLLLLGRGAWPGVAMAAFLANLTSGATPLLAVGITPGNTLAPLAAVTVLRAWRVRADLSRLRDVLALLGVGVAGMLISATFGTVALLATGTVSGTGALRAWLVWWVGDAMGVVLVAPFLLTLAARTGSPYPCSRCRMAESAALLLAAAGISQLIFGSTLTLTFLALPLVLWAAMRLPQPVVASLNLIMAGSAIWATLKGHGPFVHTTAEVRLVDLQAFNGTVACTSLILAAVIRERAFGHQRLQEAAAGLEAAVDRRTEELSAANRALAREITERQETEATLRESEERFRSFFEGTIEGAFRVRIDGTFLAVNPAMAQMLGYPSPAELLSRVPMARALLVDDARGMELAELVVATGEIRDFELELRRSDGGTIRTAVHLRVVGMGAPSATVEGILVDVTERRRAREALLAAYEREHRATAELEQLNCVKDTFIANISHEFRTPITLTLGPLQHVLAGQSGELPLEVVTQLQVAERSQHRLLRLIDQLLDLARLEQGARPLRVTRVADVNRFLEEWTAPFHTVAELRGVDVRLRLDPLAAAADLWLDHDEFDIVLGNLLSNALKFTERGHVEISTEVCDRALLLTVADTGSGIADHDLPHVFDRFSQGAGASKAGRGTGLGLALVKEIVALHGGEISVSSQTGEGTAFQVSIPLGTGHLRPGTYWQTASESGHLPPIPGTPGGLDEGADIDAVNQAAEAAFDTEKPVVLHVEDVKDLRSHVRRLLAGEYNLFLAGDGRQGLELTRRYFPDLIILDEVMPGMSGSEFVHELRADPDLRATPVIFVTARAGAEARVAGLQGADDYLAKPFHEDELRARVRNLLGARIQKRLLVEANRRLEIRVGEQLAELVRTGELRRFVPRPVGDRLLAGELGPQQAMTRSRVTVVIAGVAGFSQLAEELEPEDFSELVNSYLAEVTAVAVAHGGIVDHLAADGLMILFGAPHGGETPEHAWSAVQATQEMGHRLVEVATACRRRGITVELRLRAGVNTGHATIGIFGSDLLRTYTAMGSVVSIAARLRSEAAPGQILCTGATHAAVTDRVLSRRRETLLRKGGGRPVEVFELLEPITPARAAARPDGETAGAVIGASRPETPEGPTFRREGAYWTIAFEGPVSRLPDSKGLRYLAQLLAHPGTEFHVLQLVAADRDVGNDARVPALVRQGLHLDGDGDSGQILDAQARAAYMERLEELRENLEEGTAFHDSERAARARAEIDALTDQLAGAVGLTGRGRRTGSDVERARVNLTKRVRAAISAVGEHDPRLEHHLRGAVRTGTFCSYDPDPGLRIVWSL